MLGVLLAMALAAGPAQGPVAVMPLKNLNADPELDWMRAGIAETLVSDLKKRSGMTVVERDQVDRALAEVMLQGSKLADDSVAARVGRLTGAKTIVVGAFQKAGTQLRITARFIAVETGEVIDTAKTTGAMSEVFVLQDQIVAKLLGEVRKPPPQAVAARRAPPKRLKAYRLYAMALTTGSEADRVGLLRQSVEVDPEFSYAIEDLAKLEQRMLALRQRSIDTEGEALAVIDDPSRSPQERAQAAVQLLGKLATLRRNQRLKEVARHIIALKLPRADSMDPVEYARYYVFNADYAESVMGSAENTDAALRAGEQFLADYPRSMYFGAVETCMKAMIASRRQGAHRLEKYQAELKTLEEERAKLEADTSMHPPARHIQLMSNGFRRCTAAQSAMDQTEVVKQCGAYEAAWKQDRDETNLTVFLPSAIWAQAEALARLHRLKEAKQVAARLQEGFPTFAQDRSVEMMMGFWPTGE